MDLSTASVVSVLSLTPASLPNISSGLVCKPSSNCTLTDWVDDHSHCQPPVLRDDNVKIPILVNIGIIIIIGGIGNLLTLFSIPYCWIVHSRNQEINSLWTTTTMLILHLSLCDFLYCSYGLTGFFETYYHGYYPHTDEQCWYLAAFRNWIAYADFISMAVIALNRVYGLCTSFKRNIPTNNGQKTFGPLKYGLIGMVLIWTLAFLIISPTYLEYWGRYGYDHRHGKCESLMCTGGVQAPGIIYTYGFFVPFLVIVASYTSIAAFISCIGSNLPKSQRQVDPARIGRTMGLLSMAYFMFTMPLLPFENMGPDVLVGYRELATLIAYSWYWWMYASNFILYVAMLPRFRNAYIIFLKDVSNYIFYLLTCGRWKIWEVTDLSDGEEMKGVAGEERGIDLVQYGAKLALRNDEQVIKQHEQVMKQQNLQDAGKEQHNLAYVVEDP